MGGVEWLLVSLFIRLDIRFFLEECQAEVANQPGENPTIYERIRAVEAPFGALNCFYYVFLNRAIIYFTD